VETGVHKPDDSLTWTSINSQPWFWQDKGTPYAVMAPFAEITSRKWLEKELQEAQAELARLQGYR
jgi:hypothetical protein